MLAVARLFVWITSADRKLRDVEQGLIRRSCSSRYEDDRVVTLAGVHADHQSRPEVVFLADVFEEVRVFFPGLREPARPPRS